MKRFVLFLFIVFAFLSAKVPIYTQVLLKGGAEYSLPMNKMADINKPALGWNAQLYTNSKCRFWLGIKFASLSYEPVEELDPTVNYYTQANLIEPMLRYNFMKKKSTSYTKKVIPYLEVGGIISAMKNTDDEETSGFGGSAGAGLFYTWTMFHKCWNIDLKGAWVAPNAFLSAETRQSVQMVNASLTIGVTL